MTASGSTLLSIEEITRRIEASHNRLLDAIAPLTEEQLTAPVLGTDGWSVKDVLAHLAFWDRRLLHAVEPGDGPGGVSHLSRLLPPLIADIPYDSQWLVTVNERIYRVNRQRDLPDVLAEFAATRQRLLEVAASLSPQQVQELDSLTAPLGEPFSAMLLGAYEHYDDHAEELEAHQW